MPEGVPTDPMINHFFKNHIFFRDDLLEITRSYLREVLARNIQIWKSEFYKNPVSERNFGRKSCFGVFTHWILREFAISLYLTE